MNRTELMTACIEGNSIKIHQLLSKNLVKNINERDVFGKTALDYMHENPIYFNDIHAILFLRSYGAKSREEINNKELGILTHMLESNLSI